MARRASCRRGLRSREHMFFLDEGIPLLAGKWGTLRFIDTTYGAEVRRRETGTEKASGGIEPGQRPGIALLGRER